MPPHPRTRPRLPRKPTNKASAVIQLVVMAGVAGLLVAGLALPGIGGAGMTARNAVEEFESLDGALRIDQLPERSVILAKDGSKIADLYYRNRKSVPLSEVAPVMRAALLAVEDDRFYEHGGIDVQGTTRALLQNLLTGEVRQGGSSLSQQYVKNVLLEAAGDDKEKIEEARAPTVTRKLRELRYAMTVEQEMTKDQILESYLNISYFGDGAYGVEAAARRYFSTSAKKLTLPQAALLTGILSSPEALNPRVNAVGAVARRDIVLDRMVEVGRISAAEAAQAKKAKLGLKLSDVGNGCAESTAPFFCEYVRREMETNPAFGRTKADRQRLLRTGGLTIRTTLDPKMQKAADRALRTWVPPTNPSRKAAAEALVHPGTGEIRALGVSLKWSSSETPKRGETQVNYAADQKYGGSTGFQAGSTFKVWTLTAALEKGIPFGSRFPAPVQTVVSGFKDCEGNSAGEGIEGSWRVGNAEHAGGGSASLVTGTWNSLNTFYANLEREVGLCDVIKTAKRLGVHTATGKALPVVPSFTLGSPEVSPLTVAASFATFAARGIYCAPVAITAVQDRTGKQLRVPPRNCKRVVDEEIADAVTYILTGVIQRGTAAGLGIGRPAAAKTGTAENYSAAFFAGFTPNLAGAVWVGDPRGGHKYRMSTYCRTKTACYSPVFGATIPGPIWRDTFLRALRGAPAPDFHRPDPRFFARGDGLENKRVPRVAGLTVQEAISRLTAEGFEVEVSPVPVDSRERAGRVARTDPVEGAAISSGEQVTIFVSNGRERGRRSSCEPFPIC